MSRSRPRVRIPPLPPIALPTLLNQSFINYSSFKQLIGDLEELQAKVYDDDGRVSRCAKLRIYYVFTENQNNVVDWLFGIHLTDQHLLLRLRSRMNFSTLRWMISKRSQLWALVDSAESNWSVSKGFDFDAITGDPKSKKRVEIKTFITRKVHGLQS